MLQWYSIFNTKSYFYINIKNKLKNAKTAITNNTAT